MSLFLSFLSLFIVNINFSFCLFRIFLGPKSAFLPYIELLVGNLFLSLIISLFPFHISYIFTSLFLLLVLSLILTHILRSTCLLYTSRCV